MACTHASLLLLALAGAALAAPQAYRLEGADAGGLVTARLEGTPPATAEVTVGDQSCPCQIDPDGRLTALLPAPMAGRVARVVLGGNAPAAPLNGPTPLTVEEADGRVVVSGPTWRVTHDAKAQAGLPSRFEFLPGGKVFSGFNLNDRVYDKDLGGFLLRNDKQPSVKVVARGPLRVAVQVSASYRNEAGTQPPSHPRAVYTFLYTAGSSVVEVEAEMRQDTSFAWGELHLLEINFADTSFGAWMGGPPTEEGKFVAKASSTRHPWGALVEPGMVLGLWSPGGTILYDGRGGYGTYLHGPWADWTAPVSFLRASLFLSGRDDAKQAVAAAATQPRAARAAWLVPEATAVAMNDLRGAVRQLPPAVAARLGWWLATADNRFRRAAMAEGAALVSAVQSRLLRPRADLAELDAWFEQRTNWHTLASGELCAGFDGRGELASLYDVGAGRELLETRAPLWQLHLRDAAKKLRSWGPETWRDGGDAPSVKMTRAAQELIVTWGPPGPVVTLHARLNGPRLTLHLDVGTSAPDSLWHVEFPVVPLGNLGGDGADTTFFFPRGAGEVQHDPVGSGVSWGGTYPSGWSTMQYLALYNHAGGLYLAAEDPAASTKETFGHGPDGDGQVRYGVDWPAPDMGVIGNAWQQSGDAALEVFRGDWFDAAQVYRRWVERDAAWWPARAQARPAVNPMDTIAAWSCTGATPYEPDHVVSRTLELAHFLDVPTALHWYSWHQIPFDDHYPHYDPPKARMPEGVAELQKGGVKVMPYINGRLWDSRLDDFKAEAQAFACCDEDGKPCIEEYGSKVPLAVMCPTTPFWQAKLKSIVLWLTNDVGVDGVYMDQIAAAAPRLDFNPQHGHPLGGGHWWTTDGYWPLLKGIRASLAPGKFLTTECNSEPFVHLFDGYLTWHWQFEKQVPAFSAVYADQIRLFGRAYRGGKSAELANRMKAAQQLVFGEEIGWVDPGIVHQASGVFLKACAQMRRDLRPYLAGGRMLRPPAVVGDNPMLTADWQWSGDWPVTQPALQTAAWRAGDGSVALLVTNAGPAALHAVLSPRDLGFHGKVAVRRVGGGEAPATWSDGETLDVALGAEQVVAYVLRP